MHECSILKKFPIFILIQFNNCKSLLYRESIYDAKGVIDFIADTQQLSAAQANVGNKWPMGNVLYFLDSSSYDQHAAKRVRMVMNQLEGTSCIQFVPLIIRPESGVTYLDISNPDGIRECVHKSVTEEDSGAIRTVFGYNCLQKRDVLHTLMHALGFRDEVTHPLRDQFIRVLWSNINPKYRKLFRVTEGPVYGEYDPRSIMHFHDRAYSNNGQATVVPLLTGLMINPSTGLSPLDVMKLRVQFGRECNKRKVDNLLGTCKNVLRAQDSGNATSKKNSPTKLAINVGSGENNDEDEMNRDANENQDPNENNSGPDGKLNDAGSGEDVVNIEDVNKDFNENQDANENNSGPDGKLNDAGSGEDVVNIEDVNKDFNENQDANENNSGPDGKLNDAGSGENKGEDVGNIEDVNKDFNENQDANENNSGLDIKPTNAESGKEKMISYEYLRNINASANGIDPSKNFNFKRDYPILHFG